MILALLPRRVLVRCVVLVRVASGHTPVAVIGGSVDRHAFSHPASRNFGPGASTRRYRLLNRKPLPHPSPKRCLASIPHVARQPHRRHLTLSFTYLLPFQQSQT